MQIAFALTPSVELEHMFARFQVADGLQLVSGSETEHIEHPEKGAPVSHTLTILPKQDGIFYVTAVVLADTDKESIARTFTVPLIAGQGLAELPAAASGSEHGRAGQRHGEAISQTLVTALSCRRPRSSDGPPQKRDPRHTAGTPRPLMILARRDASVYVKHFEIQAAPRFAGRGLHARR